MSTDDEYQVYQEKVLAAFLIGVSIGIFISIGFAWMFLP